MRQAGEEREEAQAALARKTEPFEMERSIWRSRKEKAAKEAAALREQLRLKEAEEVVSRLLVFYVFRCLQVVAAAPATQLFNTN